MKVAIFHDYMDKSGGGERLVLNLARALNAHVYTGFIDRSKTFDTTGIKIISLQVPKKITQLHRNREIEKRFSEMKLDGYDVYIFSGIWCLAAAKNHKPNILYLHTPPRFLYDLKDFYLNNMNFIKRFFFRRFTNYWEPVFRSYMKYFDIIGTNSRNVKNRVLKYIGKDIYKKCTPVYTGFDTTKFYNKESEGFYLSTSRLDKLKRINILIDAFKRLDKKLVITSSGGGIFDDEKKLKELARGRQNIQFLGRVSEKKLKELYATCTATIAANIDEDLGLVALESHAAGKPCIAVEEGGFLETIKERKNGLFFKPNPDSLISAVKKCERIKWNPKYIQRTVKKYNTNIFVERIQKMMINVIKKN